MAIKLDDQIVEFLKTLSDDDRVLHLLAYSVGRVLNKMKSKKLNWRDEAMRIDLRHITHWLEISILHDEEWLENVDQDKRPKKLLKFSDLSGILKEANKAIIKRANETPVIKISAGDEVVVKVLNDGWYIVRLLTPAALDNESADMQHCVGHGIYDKSVTSGKITILSLRDRHNKSHVTIEIKTKENSICQIRGKQNEKPKPEYARRIREFIRGANFRSIDRPSEIGLIVDDCGLFHDIDELPAYLSIKGNLDLSQCELLELPEFLEVGNDLIIECSAIKLLPKGLKVSGCLKAAGSLLESVEVSHGVSGSIYLTGTPISSLPSEMHIDGDLDISGTGITKIPKDMVITGNLFATNTNINIIPSDLTVGKSMILDNSNIESFESDVIYIGGSLFIRGCKRFSLPGHLYVERSLITEKTCLFGTPNKIEVGKNLFCFQSDMGKFKNSILVGGMIIAKRFLNNTEQHFAIHPRDLPDAT